jgi:hypothetical protein
MKLPEQCKNTTHSSSDICCLLHFAYNSQRLILGTENAGGCDTEKWVIIKTTIIQTLYLQNYKNILKYTTKLLSS